MVQWRGRCPLFASVQARPDYPPTPADEHNAARAHPQPIYELYSSRLRLPNTRPVSAARSSWRMTEYPRGKMRKSIVSVTQGYVLFFEL